MSQFNHCLFPCILYLNKKFELFLCFLPVVNTIWQSSSNMASIELGAIFDSNCLTKGSSVWQNLKVALKIFNKREKTQLTNAEDLHSLD